MRNSTKRTLLYGAIVGDIIGSRFEGKKNSIKTKSFETFDRGSRFTDNTVLTVAVANGLLNCGLIDEQVVTGAVTRTMQRWGNDYPHAGYSYNFHKWLVAHNPRPYGSYGSGAAMRVSGVALIGELYGDLDLVRDVARWTAQVTHNHPDGIKSAEAVASAIFMAANGESKSAIKSYVEENFGYNLSLTLDDIRPYYCHETAAPLSVPEAIIAFLEAENFEDAIRNAVSLGGDSDTLAAITGSIAEAFYGVPGELIYQAQQKLPLEMIDVIDDINNLAKEQSSLTDT